MIINVMPCPVFFTPVLSERENQPLNLENKTANVKNGGGNDHVWPVHRTSIFSFSRYPSALARCRIVEKKFKTSVDRLDYLVISAYYTYFNLQDHINIMNSAASP